MLAARQQASGRILAAGGRVDTLEGEPIPSRVVIIEFPSRDAVIDYLVEGERPYAGPGNFDEPRLRAIAGRVSDRTNDIAASMSNHFISTKTFLAIGG